LIGLLEDKLRYVPAVEEVRIEVLDRTRKSLQQAARAMTDLRRDVGWDPKDEDRIWLTLAKAHQRLADLGLSLNRFKEAME
jgi:hypothetical protein